MYSLKWNIFLNKVIAPGFARSNNLQTKYKLNTKFSFHSLNSANANIGKPGLSECIVKFTCTLLSVSNFNRVYFIHVSCDQFLQFLYRPFLY